MIKNFLVSAFLSSVLAQSEFCAQQFPQLAPLDGSQNRQGSCSSTVQGAIPSANRMVSTLILSPSFNENIDRQKEITVSLDTLNMELGHFSDPNTEYYSSPQLLNDNGIIRGHQHVVVQKLGSANSAVDASQFVFFKGLDDPPAKANTLQVTIPPGTLPEDGLYRICTITGADSHQPVIMPVAQRGSQDDCIRINAVSGNQQNDNKKQDNRQGKQRNRGGKQGNRSGRNRKSRA